MMIIGCDFHPSWQQVSWLDTETGESGSGSWCMPRGKPSVLSATASAGADRHGSLRETASGSWNWCEDLGHEIWIGDAAQIRASYVRKQKTDQRDAAHILKLLVEDRFPRLWTPDREQRDLRQLLMHRHKLVEIRSRVKNELQHLS